MIEQASLIIGDGNWAVKSDNLLGYALPQGKYTPREMSVVRATTATRVNSLGLVELVPYNLYEHSEQFDNSYWTKAAVTISANATTAPNGTLTAEKAIGTATTTAHDVTRNLTRPSGSYTTTMSIYAKKSEDKYILLQLADGGGGIGITFDVDLGNVSAAAATYGTGWSAVSNSISSVGNGWFRIIFTATTTNASTSLNTSYRVGNIANLFGGSTGNGVNGVFIWGAQIVEGSAAKDYQRTETRLNIPRIDYSLGSYPSLLVEPQRTNLALRSQEFDNPTWQKAGGTTITANSTTAPDGTLTADTFNASQTNLLWQNLSASNNTTYTLSLWVKLGTATNICLIANNTLGWNTIGGQSFNASNGLNTSTWTRISFTFTTPVLPVGAINIHFGGNSQTGLTQSTGTVFIWGAQLEAGAYPTSYIPTTSASVTRNVDILQRTNVYTNGLITASGGTWYGEIKNNQALVRDASNYSFALKNATAFNSGIYLRQATGGAQRLAIVPYSSGSIPSGGAYTTLTDMVKFAAKWNGTSYNLFVNGVQVVSGIPYTPTQFEFLECPSGRDIPLFISAMALFPSPLTDAQCITLTTL
jgi:hypothetical protein